jgi:hypothetical protein
VNEKQIDELRKKAIQELGIDRPVSRTRLVGSRLELYLYGGDGQPLTFEEPAAKPEKKTRKKPGPKAKK